MSDKQKTQEKPSSLDSIRNGVVKDKPLIDKTAIQAPPPSKPKK